MRKNGLNPVTIGKGIGVRSSRRLRSFSIKRIDKTPNSLRKIQEEKRKKLFVKLFLKNKHKRI